MAPDGRKPWEVEWCLRLKFAASYLDMAEATGHRRYFLMTAYNTGDLREWCNKRIASILKKCEALVQEHGQPSIAALNITVSYRAVLDKSLQRVYNGSVQAE